MTQAFRDGLSHLRVVDLDVVETIVQQRRARFASGEAVSTCANLADTAGQTALLASSARFPHGAAVDFLCYLPAQSCVLLTAGVEKWYI